MNDENYLSVCYSDLLVVEPTEYNRFVSENTKIRFMSNFAYRIISFAGALVKMRSLAITSMKIVSAECLHNNNTYFSCILPL